MVNRLRGLLAEFGVFLAQGINRFRAGFVQALEDSMTEVPGLTRVALLRGWARFRGLEDEVAWYDTLIAQHAREDHSASRVAEMFVATVPDVAAGQYVLLAVTDTGTGMPPEVVERAFDPFFTTKPEGQGTGLGLSMAYGFVKQSGGHIDIYSEPGHGTTIKIYLPRSTQAAIEPPPRTRLSVKGGTETILVVEDDPKVQSTAFETLSGLGYRVLKADDAQQALTLLRSGVEIHLLFSDVEMPGPLRSPEMAAQAMRLMPHLKVLFTSGYTHNAIVHSGRLDPGVELLSKPYGRDKLAQKIRQMLDSSDKASTEPSVATIHAPGEVLRVLVVDDNPDLAEAIGEQVAALGYPCKATRSAHEALRWLREETFDVLMTDISMPDIGGIDLAKQAAEQQPQTRVLFSSGYEVIDLPSMPFQWATLQKPFTMEELGALLRGFVVS